MLTNAINDVEYPKKSTPDYFFEEFLREYNDSKHLSQISQISFHKNDYLDEEFKRVLSLIKQNAHLDTLPGTRKVHSSLLLVISETKEYMESMYESFDNTLAEKFKNSLYKAFALTLGYYLFCCYIYDSTHKEMSKLHNELFDPRIV
jgi:hypothetical protein